MIELPSTRSEIDCRAQRPAVVPGERSEGRGPSAALPSGLDRAAHGSPSRAYGAPGMTAEGGVGSVNAERVRSRETNEMTRKIDVLS